MSEISAKSDASSHQNQTQDSLQRDPGEIEQRPHTVAIQLHEGILEREIKQYQNPSNFLREGGELLHAQWSSRKKEKKRSKTHKPFKMWFGSYVFVQCLAQSSLAYFFTNIAVIAYSLTSAIGMHSLTENTGTAF